MRRGKFKFNSSRSAFHPSVTGEVGEISRMTTSLAMKMMRSELKYASMEFRFDDCVNDQLESSPRHKISTRGGPMIPSDAPALLGPLKNVYRFDTLRPALYTRTFRARNPDISTLPRARLHPPTRPHSRFISQPGQILPPLYSRYLHSHKSHALSFESVAKRNARSPRPPACPARPPLSARIARYRIN